MARARGQEQGPFPTEKRFGEGGTLTGSERPSTTHPSYGQCPLQGWYGLSLWLPSRASPAARVLLCATQRVQPHCHALCGIAWLRGSLLDVLQMELSQGSQGSRAESSCLLHGNVRSSRGWGMADRSLGRGEGQIGRAHV